VTTSEKNNISLIESTNPAGKKKQICQLVRTALKSNQDCTSFCAQLFQGKICNVYFVDCLVVHKLSEFADFERETQLTPVLEGACFIIENVEEMSAVVANRFLKKLEEPQPLVHFVLTTSNKDLVLPTIKSRCNVIIGALKSNPEQIPLEEESALVNFFLKDGVTSSFSELDRILKENPPDEHSSKICLEKLLHKTYQRAGNKTLSNKVTILNDALSDLPQSGCSNFWRYLFLKLL
jgi:DNA polymerase III delta prime subunit